MASVNSIWASVGHLLRIIYNYELRRSELSRCLEIDLFTKHCRCWEIRKNALYLNIIHSIEIFNRNLRF